MAQLVTRIDDGLARQLDQLVADGVAASRSDAVRQALEVLIDRHRRDKTAQAIVLGYQCRPQTDDDVAWADTATAKMIEEEPW